ncbi:hypothetical protein QVD17_38585 [Tagetes erecta]|uniref:RRM domain-containing protein n=1 Tax=Tagetes erecta TaxID=13708 RepID=A0AAD8JSE5_TARER|nr:hypothetical protein QVD17_38585 [Tagetes erecta]
MPESGRGKDFGRFNGAGDREELKNGQQGQDLHQQSNGNTGTQGKWNTHQTKYSRKKEEANKKKWIPKVQVTSYFVYNIPDDIDEHALWEVFNPRGELFTTCIPDKRDKCGNRFGFARFRNVSDKLGFEKNLKNIKVGGAVLGVNLSRHDRMLLDTTKVNHPPPKPNPSNAHPPNNPSMHSNLKPNSQSSFKDILTSRNNTTLPCKTIILNPNTPPCTTQWKHSSLVMEIKDLQSLDRFDEICTNIGLSNFTLQYLGGLDILITLKNIEASTELLHNIDLWAQYASRVYYWDETYNQKERIAWINIRGVPSFLWSNDTFDVIANSLGKIISPSAAKVDDVVLTVDRVAIITTQFDRILENINLKWKSENFIISIEEDFSFCFPAFMLASSSPSHVKPPVTNSPAAQESLRSSSSGSRTGTNINGGHNDVSMSDSQQPPNNINGHIINPPSETATSPPLIDKPISPIPIPCRKRQRVNHPTPYNIYLQPINFDTSSHLPAPPPLPPLENNLTFPPLYPDAPHPPPLNSIFPTSPIYISTTHPPSTIIPNSSFSPHSNPPHPNLPYSITPINSIITENIQFAKSLGIDEKECEAFVAMTNGEGVLKNSSQ